MNALRAVSCLAAALTALAPLACNRATPTGKPRVAFISNNDHEFWKIAQRGTEKAAAEAGVEVEFKMPPGGGTPETQRRFIEDLLTKGVKGIAISPNDAANQTAFFREVSDRVPLITVDSDVPDPSVRRCYLGTNNVAAGKAAAELVKKAVPDGGKLAIYVGKLDVQNAVERRFGVVVELAGGEDKCREQLEQMKRNEYPITFGKYILLGTMTDDGKQDVCRTKVDDTLSKYSDIRCMVGLWAYNPPAMLEGVKAVPGKLGQVVLVGFDENEETLQGIKDGHIFGTIVQDPFNFGYEAVKILAGLARGHEDVFRGHEIDGEHRIFVKHRIIDKGNVEEFHQELKKLKGG